MTTEGATAPMKSSEPRSRTLRALASLARPALIGNPPGNRREVRGKVLWIGVWLVFLIDPLDDLLGGAHTAPARAAGWAGLLLFVACYLTLVVRDVTRAYATVRTLVLLGLMIVLAVALPLGLGESWYVLLVYFAVSCAAALPLPYSRYAVVASAALLLVLPPLRGHDPAWDTVIPVLLGGFAMTGVRELVRTTVELRRARATVAQLAANEERLRLARDLHDLLGHSLSLITLKSELAGRMLPAHPAEAARQVTEIEQVGRQALTDVRAAVGGYRQPTLDGELAGARIALATAGIEARLPEEAPALPPEPAAALAWVLREAVTNVVRHSGARACDVSLTRRQSLQGPYLELRVEDDGEGAAGASAGHGLTGLSERLAEVGGTLTTGQARAGRRGGFVLSARVPLDDAPVGEPPKLPA
ncbi:MULTISPECIES: sensor histidine kinase [unclassified Streptomyces]|uniref:sensor histidine kinase n=1 Tax=unclassified Streptomyces TaxID=2593676 RepID=UPI00020E563C|nr:MULTISPECIES: histidine kinase [unclassified Streptomyces]ASY32924.1 histidine kinase [Streptomyces sp. CLI2509]EGJ74917.1 putative two component sensor histidine kinase [Streptomyces sp. Tu6071]